MRNKIFLKALLALWLTIAFTKNIQAQQNWDTLPWKTYSDFKLQNLNKSYVTTNILYDRMFPLANVDEYKGLPYDTNTDTTHPDHIMQAYYEIFNSAYNTTGMISPDALDDLIKTNGNSKQHPIGIFLFKFNSLDTNALQDHLIDTLPNGQFVDVANRQRSPYFTHTSFLASPMLADGQVVEEGDHEFYIDPQFFLHNENITIQSITIDFGDGTAPWVVNNPFGNPQARGGLAGIIKKLGKTILGRIIVVGVDILGQTIRYGSPFKLFVKNTKTYAPLTFCKGGGQKWVIEAPQARLAPINAQYGNPQLEYKNADGNPVKDTAYFYFAGNGSSCNTNVLSKPIVFIDGFDPTNSRDVKKIYEDYINVQVTRNGNNQTLFGDYMLNEGYDFVILDFKHGNDLLERNAMTVVSLIERLNQQYGSTMQQGITLIGPSMGSLIAQYALAYMEKNNIPHNVKTYISFDGCHQGANVPVGLQNFVEYFTRKGIFKKNKAIREGLYNGLAARQMLAHHVSANSQFPAPDALRNTFLQNLTAVNEYPQLCRKVALINGSKSGVLNPNQNASSTLLRIYTQRKGWKSLWGACQDKICMKLDWECKTTPNTGTAKVMDNWTVEPLFNLLFWVPLGRKNVYADAAWGNSAQDNAPGGTFGTFFGSNPGDINESNFVFLLKETMYLLTGSKRTSFTQHINDFTMMPSYSAADIRLPNKNLYNRFDTYCPPTPFDYIYAPTVNERHVFVSAQGSQWFENEVRGILPPPNNPPAPNLYRDYSTNDCNSMNAIASGANATCYEWSVTGDLKINGNLTTLSCGPSVVNITSDFGNGGNITVRTKIGSTCFSQSKTICYTPCLPWDNPNFRWIWSAPMTNEPLQAQVDEYPGATSYQWFINGQLVETTYSGFLSTYNWPCTSEGEGLTVLAVTDCGRTVTVGGGTYSPICYGGRIAYNVKLFPNPASSNLTVSIDDVIVAKAKTQKDVKVIEFKEIVQVKIIDKLGNIKKVVKFGKGNKTVNLNIFDLPSDVYFIEVSDGLTQAKIPLIIKK